MKHFFFFCFSLNLVSLQAQSWFEGNPAWTNYFTYGWGGPGWEYMNAGKDTLVDGLPSVAIERFFDMEFSNDFYERRFVRQSGDTILFWGMDSTFHVMYNFSLGVGDSVVIPVAYSNAHIRYIIDSLGEMEVNGQNLRFQRVQLPTGYSFFTCSALIVEKIGMINGECYNANTGNTQDNTRHFFVDELNSGATDGPEWTFCRFQNDQLEYTSSHHSCDALTGVDNNEPVKPFWSIAPNPFQDQVTVQDSGGRRSVGSLRLFDISGKELPVKITPGSQRVETAQLLPGVYILEITGDGQEKQFIRGIKY